MVWQSILWPYSIISWDLSISAGLRQALVGLCISLNCIVKRRETHRVTPTWQASSWYSMAVRVRQNPHGPPHTRKFKTMSFLSSDGSPATVESNFQKDGLKNLLWSFKKKREPETQQETANRATSASRRAGPLILGRNHARELMLGLYDRPWTDVGPVWPPVNWCWACMTARRAVNWCWASMIWAAFSRPGF